MLIPKILNYCLENKLKLVLSPEILHELENVLFRKKFDFIDKDKKKEFILLLCELAEIVSSKHKVDICRDKDDNKFIELALTAQVKYIVSGDNDLLDLKAYQEINIFSADEFLKKLKLS